MRDGIKRVEGYFEYLKFWLDEVKKKKMQRVEDERLYIYREDIDGYRQICMIYNTVTRGGNKGIKKQSGSKELIESQATERKGLDTLNE